MAGVGPLGSRLPPRSLTRTDKDGGGAGGGGRYMPNRRHDGGGDDAEHPPDHADLSAGAQEQLARRPQMPGATPDPESSNARLHILAEITHFNELHERNGSRLKAVLRPAGMGSKLVIEDPARGVNLQPFGEADIFHFAPQTVRTRLESFDRSSGSVFDSRA